MADDNELAPAAATEGAPAGTAEDETQDPTAKVIEDYRRRQAGSEKARQEAERVRDTALAELAALKATPSSPKPGETGPDIASLKRELEAQYEERFAKETAKVQGEALNARFPLARAKFPSVTDSVQLAELEGLLGEPDPAKPIGNNAARGNAGAKSIEDMTSAELQKAIKDLPREAFGLDPL